MNMKDWTDITLKQYYEIVEVLKIEDDYTVLNLLDVVYNIDSSNMTINEIKHYSNALEFTQQPIPRVSVQTKYTINGHEYETHIDLTRVTTAQFIDYQNYMKDEEKRFEKLLSVFFIPTGHTYNDGYDIREVQADLLQMDIATVQSIAFFMTEQLQTFWILFRRYLTDSLKKMKMPRMERKKIEAQLAAADFSSSELFHTLLSTAKRP